MAILYDSYGLIRATVIKSLVFETYMSYPRTAVVVRKPRRHDLGALAGERQLPMTTTHLLLAARPTPALTTAELRSTTGSPLITSTLTGLT
jgi:hypothetical protein